MVNYIPFAEFVTTLPKSSGSKGTAVPAFAVHSDAPTFIEPQLVTVEDVDASAQVTFVSARGATGKSAMAIELSNRLGAPLWSLGLDKAVSGDALDSRTSAFLGVLDPRAAGVKALPLVIVDAMDEARLKVTGVSWEEFVQSLIDYANQETHLVILGRNRTIEDVWYSMVDKINAINWYEISHFSPPQQNAYVDLRTQTTSDSSSMYSIAKGNVLTALNDVVDGSTNEEFAGYAPVLDAVARLLRPGQNYQKIASDFEDSSAGGGRLEVLRKILDSLLTREQEKVLPVAEQLGLDPARTYSPEEQIVWVASRLLKVNPPRLDWCPPEKRAEYVERLSGFLEDHPFRNENGWASPVFSSFTASKTLAYADATALYEAASSSGLLFEFVATEQSPTEHVVEELHLAAMHASLVAGQWVASTISVSIEAADESSTESVDATLLLNQSDHDSQRVNLKVILNNPGVIVLTTPLVNIDVTFPGEVQVVSRGTSVDVGPDVFIRAETLRLLGASLQISNDKSSGRDSSGPVVEFEITQAFESSASLTGNVQKDDLSIAVMPGVVLTYPWVDYRSEMDTTTPDATTDDRARRFLNKLMSLARKHGRSERAVFLKKLKGRQGLGEQQFQRAVDVLLDQQVARVDGDLLILTPEWDEHRFDGKGRPGMTSYDDKSEIWNPVLLAISNNLE